MIEQRGVGHRRRVESGKVCGGFSLTEKLHGERSRSLGDQRYRQLAHAVSVELMATGSYQNRIAQIEDEIRPVLPPHSLFRDQMVTFEVRDVDPAAGAQTCVRRRPYLAAGFYGPGLAFGAQRTPSGRRLTAKLRAFQDATS